MTELEKLKTELMKKGISVDDSHSDYWMKRLRFEINGVLHSAISGDFSYGGAEGLIEVYIPSSGKVEGWMTADEAMEYIGLKGAEGNAESKNNLE